jgi:hypothetical protein
MCVCWLVSGLQSGVIGASSFSSPSFLIYRRHNSITSMLLMDVLFQLDSLIVTWSV